MAGEAVVGARRGPGLYTTTRTWRETQRDRETERQRHRETETQRHRDTERQTNRDKTQRHREAEKHRGRSVHVTVSQVPV